MAENVSSVKPLFQTIQINHVNFAKNTERRIESKKEKKQQQICSSFQELLNFGKTEMTWEEFCTKGLSLKLANETYISEDARIVAKFNEGYLIIDPITYKIKITI